MSKVVLVGELNPYGMDPAFALYHLPRHASGNRLREHLGMSDSAYEALDKVNLCIGKWSMPAARAGVDRILDAVALRRWDVVVCMGAKVRSAFKGPAFYECSRVGLSNGIDVEGILGFHLVTLPHPSGLNRMWNEPGARGRARELLRRVAPSVAWGEP